MIYAAASKAHGKAVARSTRRATRGSASSAPMNESDGSDTPDIADASPVVKKKVKKESVISEAALDPTTPPAASQPPQAPPSPVPAPSFDGVAETAPDPPSTSPTSATEPTIKVDVDLAATVGDTGVPVAMATPVRVPGPTSQAPDATPPAASSPFSGWGSPSAFQTFTATPPSASSSRSGKGGGRAAGSPGGGRKGRGGKATGGKATPPRGGYGGYGKGGGKGGKGGNFYNVQNNAYYNGAPPQNTVQSYFELISDFKDGAMALILVLMLVPIREENITVRRLH